MKRLGVSLLAAMIAVTALPATAQGKWGDSFTAGEARNARNKGDTVPLRDIFRDLKSRYGGYQIDANLYSRGGRDVYIIDWMTGKGERRRFTVDAKTGRIQ